MPSLLAMTARAAPSAHGKGRKGSGCCEYVTLSSDSPAIGATGRRGTPVLGFSRDLARSKPPLTQWPAWTI
jgi:hypothetical protein